MQADHKKRYLNELVEEAEQLMHKVLEANEKEDWCELSEQAYYLSTTTQDIDEVSHKLSKTHKREEK